MSTSAIEIPVTASEEIAPWNYGETGNAVQKGYPLTIGQLAETKQAALVRFETPGIKDRRCVLIPLNSNTVAVGEEIDGEIIIAGTSQDIQPAIPIGTDGGTHNFTILNAKGKPIYSIQEARVIETVLFQWGPPEAA